MADRMMKKLCKRRSIRFWRIRFDGTDEYESRQEGCRALEGPEVTEGVLARPVRTYLRQASVP